MRKGFLGGVGLAVIIVAGLICVAKCTVRVPAGYVAVEYKAAIEAEQAKITAEGKAEATRIKADAEAEANKKIAESLTPELIEKQKIDKWNGDVPKVQGGNAATIVDAGDLTSGTATVKGE